MIAAIDPMTALRPLHLPPDPSFWPPAPGWWAVGLSCLVLLAVAVFLYRNRNTLSRRALQELEAIRADFQRSGDGGQAQRRVSRLLKRVALSTDRREKVASLSGQAWLAYLKERSGTPFLSAAEAETFCQGMYSPRRPEPEDLEWLFEAAGRWIERVLR